MRAYPGSSDARINPTHTLGERLLAQLKTIDRPPVRHVLGAVSSSASRSLTQRALARRCASGSSIAGSSPSHPRQRHPPRPPRSPSAPNRSTRARSIRHDHRRDDVPPADRERSRGPINLLRGSIPTSQHTANSPQGLKDGKAQPTPRLARIAHHWPLRGRRGARALPLSSWLRYSAIKTGNSNPLRHKSGATALTGLAPDRYRDNSSAGGPEKTEGSKMPVTSGPSEGARSGETRRAKSRAPRIASIGTRAEFFSNPGRAVGAPSTRCDDILPSCAVAAPT